MAAVPVGGLVVFALGFFSFLWFDDFTNHQKFFVTRMREKIAYRTVQVLSQGASYRDEMIQVGLYRSNPCTHPLRLVLGPVAGDVVPLPNQRPRSTAVVGPPGL